MTEAYYRQAITTFTSTLSLKQNMMDKSKPTAMTSFLVGSYATKY